MSDKDDDLTIETRPEIDADGDGGGLQKLTLALGAAGILGIVLGGVAIYMAAQTTRAMEQLESEVLRISQRPDRTPEIEEQIAALEQQLESLDDRLVNVGSETARAVRAAQGIRDQAQQALETLSREVRTNREQINTHADRITELHEFLTEATRPQARERNRPTPHVSAEESGTEGTDVHIIQPGDTLGGLARKYEVSLDALMRANPGVDPHRLQIGQRIVIP